MQKFDFRHFGFWNSRLTMIHCITNISKRGNKKILIIKDIDSSNFKDETNDKCILKLFICKQYIYNNIKITRKHMWKNCTCYIQCNSWGFWKLTSNKRNRWNSTLLILKLVEFNENLHLTMRWRGFKRDLHNKSRKITQETANGYKKFPNAQGCLSKHTSFDNQVWHKLRLSGLLNELHNKGTSMRSIAITFIKNMNFTELLSLSGLEILFSY